MACGGVASLKPSNDSARSRSGCRATASVRLARRDGRLQFADVSEADRQHGEQEHAGHQADGPLGGADLHVDERPLGGEHDAEDDQHERAADVDEQLRRADEVGAEQEEDAGGAAPG